MLFDETIDADVKLLIAQWNVAEERIKRAENVRDGEVVASAIFELRYAGRKIIDVLDLAINKGIEDQAVRREIFRFLADATEDCVKAKHDAIDAVLTFIIIWFHRAEKRLSFKSITEYFPNYINNTGKIKSVQRKIEASRKNRLSGRDEIYDEIAANDYEDLLQLFEVMSASADRVNAEIKRERRKKLISRMVTMASLIFGLAGFAAAIRHW